MFWMMIAAMTLAEPPSAECKSAYGVTTCGYGCVAAYGEVKCAKTPAGRCQAAYGEITCWDPDGPELHRRHFRAPGATCHSAYGETVCGYSCTEGYGQVKCARTSAGVCTAAYGKITCWDPPRDVHHGRDTATCLAEYGRIACGYGCVAAYGRLRCASSPGGVCKAAYGRIVCSD
jgi:hypothetical protein